MSYTTTLPVTFEAANCGGFFEGELLIEYSICCKEPEIENVKQRLAGQKEWQDFNGCDAADAIYEACIEDMQARHEEAMEARAEARREALMLGEL